jgi:hypothetical protein
MSTSLHPIKVDTIHGGPLPQPMARRTPDMALAMIHHRAVTRRSAAVLLSAIALLLPASLGGAVAGQEKLVPAATAWIVSPMFEKNKDARKNLSGAACVPTTPPFSSCLIANDEKKYAQFFSIEGTNITPRAVIRLVDQDAEGDPDAEGVAYDGGHLYVVGSHGRSRHGDKANDGSYVVFRFPVDKATGRPPFKPSEDEVVGIDSSPRLRDALRNGRIIKDFYDKPLASNGVNIEGIAVKDGRMYLGLRGPSHAGTAFVLSVDAKAVFTETQSLDAKVLDLRLGKDTGIRDLASVSDGVLVLSGPVNEQDIEPALFHWDEKTGSLTELGELQLPAHLANKPKEERPKAEILLVLQDKANEPWRVLVMFDGPENGAPTEYLVARKRP